MDKDLQDKVTANRAQAAEIYSQLDPEQTAILIPKLKQFLTSESSSLPELLDVFLNMDDSNLISRIEYFYKEIAPFIILYKVKIGDTFSVTSFSKTGYSSSVNLKVYGTYKFKSFESSPLASGFSLMDMISFRKLFGFMTDERRQAVLEICRQHDILILEDNPYGLLGFDSDPHRALRADEAEGVIYLGSFSKTFAPGFRVGWVLAPHAVREKLVLAQESATLCPSNFSQMAISTYLDKHDWKQQIKDFQQMYRERRDAMIEALDDLMPASCTWNVPSGGFYVWLTLPPGIDAKAMLPRAVTARVAYVPGTAFYADQFGTSSMRLSFCYPTPERIREGVRRLAGVLEAELELRETFDSFAAPRLSRGYESPNTDLT